MSADSEMVGCMAIHILMLGEGLDCLGGIVSVEKIILQHASAEFKYKHIATLRHGSAVRKAAVFAIACCNLVKTLLTEPVDVVHIHMSERGSSFRHLITSLITLAFRKPIVMHSHSAMFQDFYAELPQVIKRTMQQVFGRCDRFVVLSESWRSFFIENLKLDPKRVVLLPNPVVLPPNVPDRVGTTDLKLVFLGRIGSRKGAFNLLQAFALVDSHLRERIHLVMAGDGEIAKAKQLANRLGITDRVQIVGWLDQEDRDALLTEANMLILPSYNEGLPMALLEAMSWGLPVISTPVGGTPEVVTHKHNGLLVEPGDIHGLAEAMERLITDEGLRSRLGKAARASVKDLNVDQYRMNLERIYRSALTLK
ncbi:glycosyltransferase family 4 protein [Leptolyngbya sp. AN02str]|uniref:glycosyltransferase family 4 protein n=1 Tax=Leptolyngbya sp. AN02str TaxID=3423363 RepID=UPI003D322B46